MKQGAAQGAKTEVEKQCLTKEKLNDGSTFRNFFLRAEATDPQTVNGTMQVLVDGGDRTMQLNSRFTAPWGASCGDVSSNPSTFTNHSEHHDHHN
jgi:hypothetical protein